jgi:hypothetical protein
MFVVPKGFDDPRIRRSSRLTRLIDDLRPFGRPADYPQAFTRNFAVINGVARRGSLRNLVERLALAADIPENLALIDLKRYLLNTYEYRPQFLRPVPGRHAKWLLALCYLYVTGLRRRAPKSRVVLVDDWYPDSDQTFYGLALLRSLTEMTTTAMMDVSTYRHIHTRDFVWAVRCWLKLRKATRNASRSEGVDLTHYVFTVLRHILAGRSLKRIATPRVILSGNDNNFPPIRAWSAGARLVLLQNGIRGCLSDSAFVYADHYLALSGPRLNPNRRQIGCQFGEMQFVGSIRLARHLCSRTRPPAQYIYDLLFISGGVIANEEFDRTFGHWYLTEYEREAIRQVNDLTNDGIKVAYYPCYPGELDTLRDEGLLCPSVRYLEYKYGRVYDAIESAGAVVAMMSTTILESLALGKPAGVVNLSGNKFLSAPFYEDGLVFEGSDDDCALPHFIKSLHAQTLDRAGYIVQREDLIHAVVRTVAKAAGLVEADPTVRVCRCR